MKQNKKDILDIFKNRDAGFTVPENYFVQFESNLKEDENKIKSGFIPPDDYFDQLEASILVRSILDGKRSPGFKTPKNYFKYVDQKLLYNVDKKKSKKIIRLFTDKSLKVLSYSIAASLLLFFSLYNFNSKDQGFDLETIEISEIESWIDEDLISFSSYDISETFDEIYLSGDNNYTENEILDYLDGENIENLIIEN